MTTSDGKREYFRGDALSELSGITDLPITTIETVLDAIDQIGLQPKDWQPRTPSQLDQDPRLHGIRRKCTGPTCHAPIFWAHGRKAMLPVDFRPADVTVGTIRLLWPKDVDTLHMSFIQPTADIVRVLEARETLYPGERWYRPHWETCPHANDFRSRKPSSTLRPR